MSLPIKKILLLWSPLADYSVACLRELARRPGVELYLIYHPGDPNAPYTDLDVSFCREAIPYSQLSPAQLEQFCYSLQPDTVFMASWNYRLYRKITRRLRRQGSYVVSTFDRQWLGTPKQWLGVLTSAIYLKPSIDNFFVAGDRQATFARKLGYGNPYQGYYCANTDRFGELATSSPRNFVFVGRLVEDKGVETLLRAYARYRATTTEPWGLLLCGKGHLESRCQGQAGVQVLGFAQPTELPARLAQASCLVLPSVFEPWGLVVHEAAAAGLAIIASHAVGAATYFVRDGQNGYIIHPDEDSLARALRLVAEADTPRLTAMRQTSHDLAALWTLDKWADYVHNTICEVKNQVRQLTHT
jgi:glycosyltransferase involved in cell wall biosynthesis